MVDFDKLYSESAEQALIGSIFIDPTQAPALLERFSAEEFYFLGHQHVWRALQTCARQGGIDLLLVANELERTGGLETLPLLSTAEQLERTDPLPGINRIGYLVSLINATPTAINAEHYARIVHHYAARRALLPLASRLVQLAQQDDLPPESLFDQVGSLVTEVTRRFGTGGAVHSLAELVPTVQSELQAILEGHTPPAVYTGLADLDRMIGGFFPGDLTIVAARPGVGKTTFLLTAAQNAARNGKKVMIFSLEMGSGQLIRRLVAGPAGVDSARLRSGPLEPAEWPGLSHGLTRLTELPIWIDDTAAVPLSHLRSVVTTQALREGVDLIIVDYLQLVRPGMTSRNRTEEIGLITAGLKALGREVGVPVMAAAQLNRGVEQRQDKRPTLSDLREGGSQEQDADHVIFLHRPGLYGEDQPTNLTELIVAKHRHGPTGMVHAIFRPREQDFVGAVRLEVASYA